MAVDVFIRTFVFNIFLDHSTPRCTLDKNVSLSHSTVSTLVKFFFNVSPKLLQVCLSANMALSVAIGPYLMQRHAKVIGYGEYESYVNVTKLNSININLLNCLHNNFV